MTDLSQRVLDSDEFCMCLEVALRHWDDHVANANAPRTLYGGNIAAERISFEALRNMLKFILNAFKVHEKIKDAMENLLDSDDIPVCISSIDVMRGYLESIRFLLCEIENLSATLIKLNNEKSDQESSLASVNDSYMNHVLLKDAEETAVESAVKEAVTSLDDFRHEVRGNELATRTVAPAVISTVSAAIKHVVPPIMSPLVCSLVAGQLLKYGVENLLKPYLYSKNESRREAAAAAKQKARTQIGNIVSTSSVVKELRDELESIAEKIDQCCKMLLDCSSKQATITTNLNITPRLSLDEFEACAPDSETLAQCSMALLAGYRCVTKYDREYCFVESFDELIEEYSICIEKWESVAHKFIAEGNDNGARLAIIESIHLRAKKGTCIIDNITIELNKLHGQAVSADTSPNESIRLFQICVQLITKRATAWGALHTQLVQWSTENGDHFREHLYNCDQHSDRCESYRLEYLYESAKAGLDANYVKCKNGLLTVSEWKSQIPSVKKALTECIVHAHEKSPPYQGTRYQFWWETRLIELKKVWKDFLSTLDKCTMVLHRSR